MKLSYSEWDPEMSSVFSARLGKTFPLKFFLQELSICIVWTTFDELYCRETGLKTEHYTANSFFFPLQDSKFEHHEFISDSVPRYSFLLLIFFYELYPRIYIIEGWMIQYLSNLAKLRSLARDSKWEPGMSVTFYLHTYFVLRKNVWTQGWR